MAKLGHGNPSWVALENEAIHVCCKEDLIHEEAVFLADWVVRPSLGVGSETLLALTASVYRAS